MKASTLRQTNYFSTHNRAERRVQILLARSRHIMERQRTPFTALQQTDAEARDMRRLHRTFLHLSDALRERDRARYRHLTLEVHDLRSPLMVADGAARQLRNTRFESLSGEEREAWLNCIIGSVVSMQLLISNLLDEAREAAGECAQHQPHQTVNLAFLARDIMRDYAPVVSRHTLTFTSDGGGADSESTGDCIVSGDREELRRLLLNLLSNAVKCSAIGREICVSVWRRDESVFLLVEDEGCGVATTKTERLFLPFVRLDATHEGEGYGSRLAAIKRITDAHGATVTVQGVSGQGTTFEVQFRAQKG